MHAGEVRIINGRLSYVTTYYPQPSNWVTWRTIRKDGTLGKQFKGYYNGENKFSKPIDHELVVKVDVFDLLKVKE